ncbi:hypothetical protein [Curtobacterium sp. RRHDQ10]
MSETITEVAIVIVGLAALGIFAGEVVHPRRRRHERIKARRSRH